MLLLPPDLHAPRGPPAAGAPPPPPRRSPPGPRGELRGVHHPRHADAGPAAQHQRGHGLVPRGPARRTRRLRPGPARLAEDRAGREELVREEPGQEQVAAVAAWGGGRLGWGRGVPVLPLPGGIRRGDLHAGQAPNRGERPRERRPWLEFSSLGFDNLGDEMEGSTAGFRRKEVEAAPRFTGRWWQNGRERQSRQEGRGH
jgi:hypothetical protein